MSITAGRNINAGAIFAADALKSAQTQKQADAKRIAELERELAGAKSSLRMLADVNANLYERLCSLEQDNAALVARNHALVTTVQDLEEKNAEALKV
jgi:cell division protein FtsB